MAVNSSKPTGQETVALPLLDALELVPPPVKDYLLSDAVGAARVAAWDAGKLNTAERDIAQYLELSVFFKSLELAKFADTLYGTLGWDESREETAARLAADIMGKVMFPADAWIGDVAAAIRDLGFDPAKYPHEKIRLGTLTYDEAVADFVRRIGLDAPGADGETARRAAKVAESFLRGVRTETMTAEALGKSKKVGGVGLEGEKLAAAVSALRDIAERNVLMDELPVAEHGPEEVHGSAPTESDSVAAKTWDKAAIAALYAGSPQEQAALTAAREALRVDGDRNVLSKFAAEVVGEEKEESDDRAVVAGTLMLAEAGVLLKSLRDPSIRDAFRQHLGYAGLADMAAKLEADPEDPTLFEPYLTFLLRVKTGLTESDAARFALKALNAMKKAGIKDLAVKVAFHPETGQFVWEK